MVERDVIPFEPDASHEDEAALWIARLDEAALTDDQKAAFGAWYKESQLNARAFDELAELYGQFDIVADLREIAAAPVVEEALETDAADNERNRRLMAGGLVAAALAVIVIGAQFAPRFLPFERSQPIYEASISTSVGETQRLALADGSNVVVNSRTRADITYTKASREVDLKSGEAFFDVAHDPNAPFRVNTPNGTVRAVGTAFSVKILNGETRVLVTEGRVEVKGAQALSDAAAELLAAGERADVRRDTIERSAPEEAAIDKALDWSDGILSFKGEALEEVIVRISQYTDLDIVIVDDQLRNQPIGGYFKIGETETLFQALEIMTDVKVTRTGENRVELSRAEG